MNRYKLTVFLLLLSLISSNLCITYLDFADDPKFPPNTKVYIDSMVDIGEVVEFNPRTQMLIKMWDGNKDRYIKIVEKDDVYEF